MKERTIATEVFDRSDAFDSGDDTIVRVGAREVRKRLAQYYTSPEGAHEKIRIGLPPGSYVPAFVQAEAVGFSAVETSHFLTEAPTRKRSRWLWLLSLAGIAVASVVGIMLAPGLSRRSSFDEFWTPMWNSPDPVLIAIAHPVVYHPSSRAIRLNDQRLGPTVVPSQRPIQLPPKELDGSDMIPVVDQYVGYGDTVTACGISVLLAKHSKDARLRPASKLEFGDFREMPTALIGAYTNQWTLEFTQAFRFHFGYDQQHAPAILDSADSSHFWSIPLKKDNGASPEDYFIVGRLSNSPSGKPIVIAAGLTQFGTEAAGRFLLDVARMDDTLGKIGANWQTRNLEIVFHAKVIGNAPSASQLLAWHVW